MKTYSKLKNCEHIETCRLCLNMVEKTFDIFDSGSISIEELIVSSLHITVAKNDGLPTKICKDCHEFLMKLSAFKTTCKTADEWLRQATRSNSQATAVTNCKSIQYEIDDLQNEQDEANDKGVELPASNIKSASQQELNETQDTSCSEPLLKESTSLSEENKVWIKYEDDTADIDIVTTVVSTGCSSINSEVLIAERPTCGQCNKNFGSKRALTRHLRVHRGEKRHICSVCGATFAQSGVLKRHLLLHDNIKPWSCTVCGRGFVQKSNLKIHMRTHLVKDDESYSCKLCDKVFKFGSSLSRHMLQHKGVIFKCEICNKVLSDTSSFARHLKNRH